MMDSTVCCFRRTLPM